MAAWTWIHRGDERESRGEAQRGRGARDRHEAILHRLTERFEHSAWKLEQLVEKKDTMVRQTHLAGPRRGAPADEPRGGDRMVRRPEGTTRHGAEGRVEQA